MEKLNLKPAEVVARWNGAVTVGTLANWRVQGKGPVYIKIGYSVRYPVASLEEWEATRLRGANDNSKPHTEKIAS